MHAHSKYSNDTPTKLHASSRIGAVQGAAQHPHQQQACSRPSQGSRHPATYLANLCNSQLQPACHATGSGSPPVFQVPSRALMACISASLRLKSNSCRFWGMWSRLALRGMTTWPSCSAQRSTTWPTFLPGWRAATACQGAQQAAGGGKQGQQGAVAAGLPGGSWVPDSCGGRWSAHPV